MLRASTPARTLSRMGQLLEAGSRGKIADHSGRAACSGASRRAARNLSRYFLTYYRPVANIDWEQSSSEADSALGTRVSGIFRCVGVDRRRGETMSVWEREYGSTTRGHIVTLLRGGDITASRSSRRSSVSRTTPCVRISTILQREQIVQPSACATRAASGSRPQSTASPPARSRFSRERILRCCQRCLRSCERTRRRGCDAPAAAARRTSHGAPGSAPKAASRRACAPVEAARMSSADPPQSSREGDAFVIRGARMSAVRGGRIVPRDVSRGGADAHRGDGSCSGGVVRSRRASKLPVQSADAGIARGANHFEEAGT